MYQASLEKTLFPRIIYIINETIISACDDSSEYCSYWQQNWGCSYGSVGTNCRKTCNLCGTGKS